MINLQQLLVFEYKSTYDLTVKKNYSTPKIYLAGTDLRHIQLLLVQNSTKTTEIYTHVVTSSFSSIKNPLDS